MKRQYAHVADGILRNRGNILRVGLNSVHTVARTCEVNRMSDLIERQAAINTVKKHYRVDNDLLEVIVYQLENLPSAQPEPKWIPCSERLPEEHIGFYLVTIQKRRITALNVVGCDNMVYDIDIARWDYDRRAPQRGYHWCKADKVIAWMPLPEPYRAERRTDGSD